MPRNQRTCTAWLRACDHNRPLVRTGLARGLTGLVSGLKMPNPINGLIGPFKTRKGVPDLRWAETDQGRPYRAHAERKLACQSQTTKGLRQGGARPKRVFCRPEKATLVLERAHVRLEWPTLCLQGPIPGLKEHILWRGEGIPHLSIMRVLFCARMFRGFR